MRINLITVDRKQNNYIQSTLDSLRKSDWRGRPHTVTLFAGGDDTEYLKDLGFDILPWREAKPEHPRLGFCMNYARALRHGFGDVVIVEDDLEFCPDWLARLNEAIDEIKMEKYILALYSAIDLSPGAFDLGRHYRSYFAPSFFGTQAMYYPESVRYELADFIYQNRNRKPGDLLISEWATTNNCLYSLQGSVVQHMGIVSTGCASFHHRAWNLLCDGT